MSLPNNEKWVPQQSEGALESRDKQGLKCLVDTFDMRLLHTLVRRTAT